MTGDDLAGAPFLDDDERAEVAWLTARQGDPAAPAPSAKLASDHAELAALLDDLPVGAVDPRWSDEVLRLAAPAPRPWWRRSSIRWLGAGAVLAAAAAIILLALPRAPRELEVAIRHLDETRGDAAEVVVGDHLVVSAHPHGAGELAVFGPGGAPVARCPGGPACRTTDDGAYRLEITLDAPVAYQVVLVVGPSPAPAAATLDAYLDAARAANARIVLPPAIAVH